MSTVIGVFKQPTYPIKRKNKQDCSFLLDLIRGMNELFLDKHYSVLTLVSLRSGNKASFRQQRP